MKNKALKELVGAGVISGGVALGMFTPAGPIISVLKDIFDKALKARAESFFKKLNKRLLERSSECLYNDKEGHNYSQKLQASKSLQAYLFDFTQSATRTTSELAISMLAIACAELIADENTTKKPFLIKVCMALREITDEELNFFEGVTDQKKLEEFVIKNPHFQKLREENGYYIFTLRKVEHGISPNLLTTYLYSMPKEEVITNIDSLQGRKMLLPCQIPSMDDQGIECFGVGNTSREFRELMEKAKYSFQI